MKNTIKNVLITAQKNEFEINLAKIFMREGYKVFIAGENETTDENETADKIDLYIDVNDERNESDSFSIREGLNEELIQTIYEANVLKSMKTLEKYLPLLDSGDGKRLCFLSSAEASINETRDTKGYAYKMSKAAMHMFIQMASNKLTPTGYTWRIYDPMCGKVNTEASAEAAFNYFTRKRGSERDDPLRNDENRLVFRDALGREHTW